MFVGIIEGGRATFQQMRMHCWTVRWVYKDQKIRYFTISNTIRYMYFIIKHQINIQLLSVLFHDITVVLYIVISMKAGLFFYEFCLLHFFSGIYIEYHYDKRWMLQTIYKCWKKMVTKHPSQLVQKTVSWQIYNEQATHPTDYRMSTECLQRYAVQSSDQT